MKHLIWECCYHEDSLPAEWQRLIKANEETMLWARGLVDSPDYRPLVGVDSMQVTGLMDDVWPNPDWTQPSTSHWSQSNLY